MRKGVKRQHNPHIPAHIDQAMLPVGLYYDHRSAGTWYILSFDEAGIRRRKNVANSKALLSDLHKIMEDRASEGRGTLQWLCDQFFASESFSSLSKAARADYKFCGKILCNFPTKIGKPLGSMAVDKFSVPLVQVIIDKMAKEGTPAKAVHCLRFLRRLVNWGVNRGHCKFVIPRATVELPKQRNRRRLPDPAIMTKLIRFAFERGKLPRGQAGAAAPYLWLLMDIAYLCRLRGIELVTLTDAAISTDGILTNRRKGSRDNIVRWTPRLRQAVEAAQARRQAIWRKKSMPVPLRPEQRRLVVAAHGGALQKSSLDSAFQRLIEQAIKAEILTEDQRFGLHDLKRRGVTDTPGNRADKQEASGHKSEQMLDVYDFSVPIVDAPILPS